MNRTLLVNEYTSLVNAVEGQMKRGSTGVSIEIPDSYFQISEKEKQESVERNNRTKLLQNFQGTEDKRHTQKPEYRKGQHTTNSYNINNQTKYRKDTANVSPAKKTEHSTSQPDRKDAIISALKRKSNLTIKDISSIVTGCSNKTIQRELLSLIKDNVVKKDGERRWSRYSIIL